MNDPTPRLQDLESLYRRAFRDYGVRALWFMRALDRPTPEDALVVARALRIEGDREARRLASRPAVPLSKIQTDILRLLASHRDPESYVAGGTPLNRDATRYSGDIDVFQDREERVAQAALSDTETLLGRIVALVYNWWTNFMRSGIPDKHAEAITSRPLAARHRAANRHGNQTTVEITSTHAKAQQIAEILTEVSRFLQYVLLGHVSVQTTERYLGAPRGFHRR